LELLEEILIRLSHMVVDFPEITEMDINPLILFEKQAIAVDARIILLPSPISSPHHLVISPYPNEYENTVTTKGGLNIFVRPIKPEDAPLVVDLFQVLSQQSIYYRFFSPIKSIRKDMLVRLTQIDYDLDIALVAMDRSQKDEKMLGMARIMTKPGGIDPEFAVLVGDPWQGKGIGAILMQQLISIAKTRGLDSITGLILGANKNMLALARELGFIISKVPDSREFEAKINLNRMEAAA
jgi:acetyltransferase